MTNKIMALSKEEQRERARQQMASSERNDLIKRLVNGTIQSITPEENRLLNKKNKTSKRRTPAFIISQRFRRIQ